MSKNLKAKGKKSKVKFKWNGTVNTENNTPEEIHKEILKITKDIMEMKLDEDDFSSLVDGSFHISIKRVKEKKPSNKSGSVLHKISDKIKKIKDNKSFTKEKSDDKSDDDEIVSGTL